MYVLHGHVTSSLSAHLPVLHILADFAR